MAKAPLKLTLSPSRDIPFDRLVLSQANVRRIKTGVSIAELADDIYRRTLLQSLNVRPMLDDKGNETGMFEVPAGGRRFRALEHLVKTKRMAGDALVPCIVKPVDGTISPEEDSLAENIFRQSLHPLDQFRAMQTMVANGDAIEAVAAHFMTTPAVVRQRLKLASVSPALHEIYAEDAMSLDQLMAFSVSDDHARQEQVWAMLAHSHNKSAAFIRARLTEDSVRAADKRVRFVTIDAYVAEGGLVLRDLFEPDDGGWLSDPALLDRLVDRKLKCAAEAIEAERWKWVTAAVDLPWNAAQGMRVVAGSEVPMSEEDTALLRSLEAEGEAIEAEWSDESDVPAEIHTRLEAIDHAIRSLVDRPVIYNADDMRVAGAFVAVALDGSLSVERGFVRPDDEPQGDPGGAPDPALSSIEHPAKIDGRPEDDGDGSVGRAGGGDGEDGEDGVGGDVRPLSDRLVADLTAWRTLALQDAVAQDPATAYLALLHALVLGSFTFASSESCVQARVTEVSFQSPPEGLRDSAPAQAIAARAASWKARLPRSDKDLWSALSAMDADERADLLAHCVSLGVNAYREVLPKYDNGRISAHGLERRIAHSDVLAGAVGLDVVAAGWRPTVDGYFRSVTKSRILCDVSEARGTQFADMIAHMKKSDMAREAERLLDDARWLPKPLRTPTEAAGSTTAAAPSAQAVPPAPSLPRFLEDEDNADSPTASDDESDGAAGTVDAGGSVESNDMGHAGYDIAAE